VSVRDIARANGISDVNRVRAGRRIVIPSPGAATATTHVVGRGENLTVIARRYGTTVRALQDANGLSDPHRVRVGRRLTVPGSASVRGSRSEYVVPSFVPASRRHLAAHFTRYAAEAGVPADLVMAIGWQESGWQTHKVSYADAVGVMQLIPDTVRYTSRRLLDTAPLDPRDPAQNIRMGSHFLAHLLELTGGDVEAALHGWFQGLASVRKRGPDTATRRFAANVLALRKRF